MYVGKDVRCFVLVLVRVQVFVYWLICVVLFRVIYEYCIARFIGICFVYVMYMYVRIGWVWCTLCKFSKSKSCVCVCRGAGSGALCIQAVVRCFGFVGQLWASLH